MKHYGDITKINGADVPIVDIICGGSPCQDFSIANGNRTGLDGERSSLFMEQIRIIKEMRIYDAADGRAIEFVRPRFFVWENVKGVFSANERTAFQKILTEIVRIVEPNAPDVPMSDGGADGRNPAACTMKWENGALLGVYTTRSFGERPSEERESHLWQILEVCVPQKYFLSAKACEGILRRCSGKKIPKVLEDALRSVFKNAPDVRGGQGNSDPEGQNGSLVHCAESERACG